MAIKVIRKIENTCKTEKRPRWYPSVLVECSNCWKQYPMLKKYIWKRQYCASCANKIRCTKPPELRARYHKRHWHHMKWTHFYKKRTSMLWRCNYSSVHWFKNYGGRWIKCLWNSFEEFRDDMYDSYLEHYKIHWEDTTLDRIDVNWDYCKENCRRLTMAEQQKYKRNNRVFTYLWITYPTLKWLCEKFWKDYHCVFERLKRWWSIEKAMS